MTKNFNREHLAEEIAKQNGISRTAARDSINHVLDGIEALLVEGTRTNGSARIIFAGFGTFRTYKMKERDGRNPRTGLPAKIPAYRRIGFSAGATLKNNVNAIK